MGLIASKEADSIRLDIDGLTKSHVELSKKSRDVVKLSKELIYASNRGDLKTAKEKLASIRKERGNLDKLASKPKLRYYFPYILAVQEYVEAVAFYWIIAKKRIPTRSELKADADVYVMGLSDLTGELVRKAVDDMIREDYKHAILMKEIVAEIYGLVLGIDFEGGDMRKKADQVKWNLNKLEDLIYDARIRDKI
ncbi:MAG: hypothetical protein NTU61_00770 [Candidatus Altiarchaeota archaeon]|nr:hypothetical protein [Candidatus Altiarchaeota archaeon]